MNGHYARQTKAGRRPMKFCAICGEQVQSDNTKLIRHCQHHHKDLATASCFNEGYLLYGC